MSTPTPTPTPPAPRPSTAPTPTRGPDARLRLAALVLAGLGVLGLVGVGVMYALDDDAPVAPVREQADDDSAGEAVADAGEDVAPDDGPAAVPTITSAGPAGSTANGGIVVGRDGVAGAQVPDDAVVVAVYLDFLCPYCAWFEELNGPTLADLREDGTIVVEYHPVSILDRLSAGTAYSTRAATAAALVADRAPETFDAFATALFAEQPDENTTGLTDGEIADVARSAGVPEDVAAVIASSEYLMGEDSFATWVTEATAVASAELGGLGTPTIVIDGTVLDPRVHDWTVPGELARAITG